MDTFDVVVSLVLAAAALVTVWFAWQASKQGAIAAQSAKETVAASREVAGHTGATVEAVRQVAEHARATVDAFNEALAAAEHARQVLQLRDIGQLAEAAFWLATDAAHVARPAAWRLPEQNYLAQALVGVASPLPKCEALAQGGGTPEIVMGKAAAAREEVSAALRAMHEE